VLLFPPVKINLGLNVVARRSDGYHDLQTCYVLVPGCCDALEVLPAATSTLLLTGLEIPGSTEENLVWKAFTLLQKEYDLPPTYLHLHKRIPAGSGTGGGSSDATYTLRGLNELYNLKLSPDQIAAYAAELGSDCPFFAYNTPMLGHGRGELLSPLPELGFTFWCSLTFPAQHISTREAFSGITPQPASIDLEELWNEPSRWASHLKNNFESSVFARLPELGRIKQSHYDLGAIYSAMSGSGSAVFGLYTPETFVNANTSTHQNTNGDNFIKGWHETEFGPSWGGLIHI
jgi:4-diphosphocytidyl-2-C-methyl-D-erythritol kinase